MKYIAAFVVGLVLVLIVRATQVYLHQDPAFIPQTSTFKFQPPKQAVQGMVSAVSGEVKKQSRDKENPEDLKLYDRVLQGETVNTAQTSTVRIGFTDIAAVEIGEQTDLSFVSLIPAQFLLVQSTGKITYQVLKNHSVSIRSKHLLVVLSEGKMRLSINEASGQQDLVMLSGTAKIGLVDKENETHGWNLKQGQRTVIDDEERTVTID